MPHAVFSPPAIAPPERTPPFWKNLELMLDNPMEAWPRAVYETPVYTPPGALFRRT